MGVRFPFAASGTILSSPVVTTAETIVGTTPQFIPPTDGALILITATVLATAGINATVFSMRLYRGTTLAGVLLTPNPYNLGCATGSFTGATINVVDNLASTSPVQYSVSVQMTAATGNTTVTVAAIVAMAL